MLFDLKKKKLTLKLKKKNFSKNFKELFDVNVENRNFGEFKQRYLEI